MTPEDRENIAAAAKKPAQPAIARLLEAERKADGIVKRAREEAAEIVADAKRRAQRTVETAASNATSHSEASKVRDKSEQQNQALAQEARRHIEAMRAASASQLIQAVNQLVALLVGES